MPEQHLYEYKQTFKLESGESLPGFQLAYSTYGQLSPRHDNVVWVCHALTGNSDFTEWWPGLFGKGKVYDPADWFIVCANTLGGCYGSTGPLSTNPATQAPYYHTFPQLTNRDIVDAFDLLRQELGLEKIHTLIGGSLGGQQALEWAIKSPGVFERLIHVASNVRHSAWGIAFNESQRMAIRLDPTWATSTDNAGQEGLKTARSIAMLSYRHYNSYEKSQVDADENILEGYRATSYQRYQGEKLANRFNAYTYWLLSQAMDSHHVGRHRGGLEAALRLLKARTLVIGVDSDILFPVSEQQYLHAHVPGSVLRILHSDYGHDGFLVETAQLAQAIHKFYEEENTLESVVYEGRQR